MESYSREESLKGIGSTIHKVGSESIAADIFHFVFVGEGRNCTCWVFFGEGLVEKDEVGEASADGGGGLLEGGEVCLGLLVGGLFDEW